MVLSEAIGRVLGGVLAVGLTNLGIGIGQAVLMSGPVGACQQVAGVVGQVAVLGGTVAVLRLQEGIGIGVAVHLCVGIQVVAHQIHLCLGILGQGVALGLCGIGHSQDGLGGVGGFLDEVVSPGLAGLFVVYLLVQGLGGVQAEHRQVVAIGVDIVVDVVDVVVAQLGVAQGMLANRCGHGVFLVGATGFDGAADAHANGNGNQHHQHHHKSDAV